MKSLYEREIDYRLTTNIVRCMHRRGLITYPEFYRMNRVLIRKLHPVLGWLSYILDKKNTDIA